MVLAKPIYDNTNRILLSSRKKLTAGIIHKLELRGFPGLYIEDSLSEGLIIEEAIPIELRNQGVDALRRGDIDGTLDVAKLIVEQILQSSGVSLDLMDLRNYDDYTYRHCVNVSVISSIIGLQMGLSHIEMEELACASIFHDLGKVLIETDILNKPSKLTRSEFDIIKEHSRHSFNLLKNHWNISSKTRISVLHHHENEDGTGYPKGLKGDQIPLYSKIIHVADVYDALTSKRPYKNPYARAEALEYLMGGCDCMFDSKVVHAFKKAVPIYPKGITIKLSDGQECIVIENTSNSLRPIVRLLDGQEINLNNSIEHYNLTIHPESTVETDFSDEMGRRNRTFTYEI
jgi:HD-GYP domain-containing protein (c-di-GMP phosphodiesterase class II)